LQGASDAVLKGELAPATHAGWCAYVTCYTTC